MKSKCLSSWDTNAGVLLMIRLSSQVPSPYWFAVYVLVFFFLFFLKPWRNASLACFMFFVWQDIKLHWKPCFFGAIPQSYRRGCAPGFIPQFGSNKTLFHSDYRFFIIFLNIIKMKYLLSTFVKSQSDWSFSQWLLKPRFRNLLKWFTKKLSRVLSK